MAFKFQVGAARLSGSTTFEEAVAGLGEVKGNTLVSDSTVSGSGLVSGIGVRVDTDGTIGTVSDTDLLKLVDDKLEVAGEVTGSGVISGFDLVIQAGRTIGVNGDTDLLTLDSDSVTVAGAVSGSGRIDAIGLRIDTNGVIGTAGDNDLLTLANNQLTVAGAVSGSGRVDAIGLRIDTNGVIGTAGDNDLLTLKNNELSVAGAVKGTNLSGSGTLEIGGTVQFDGAADVTEGLDRANDSLYILDATDNRLKSVGLADFMTGSAGEGLSASDGVLAVDLNELSVSAIDVTNASLAFVSGSGANETERITVANFVNAIAGAGTQESNGQITVAGTNAFPLSDSNQNLSGGINFFSGAIGSARTLTLPAASDDYKGVQFIVKASTNTSNTLTVTITASSDDQVRIDGSTDPVVLESPGAAVTLVGLGATHGWAII